MAIYLLHRVRPEDRNSAGIHTVIVEAATEQDARDLAQAAALTGEVRIATTWTAVQIAASGSLPKNPIYIEGDTVSLLGMTRGGDPA